MKKCVRVCAGVCGCVDVLDARAGLLPFLLLLRPFIKILVAAKVFRGNSCGFLVKVNQPPEQFRISL